MINGEFVPTQGQAAYRPRQYELEPCCRKKHAWWVVSGSYFISTFPTKAEAEAEIERLLRDLPTLSEASS